MTKKELIEQIKYIMTSIHASVYTNSKQNTYLVYNLFDDTKCIINKLVIETRLDTFNSAVEGSGVKAVIYYKKDERHTIHFPGLNNKNADKIYTLLRMRGYFA